MPSSRWTLRQRSPPCRARKRHFKAGQSLRHGLRPCHLPLTREANFWQSCGPPGRPQLCVIATPVGDDACTAPAGAFRRPTGPQGPALRLEIVPGDPAAAPTSPGGINPAPTINGRPVPTGEPHLLQPMGASAFMAFRFPPGRTPTRGRRHPPRSGAAARRTRRAAAAGGSAAS